MMLLMGMGGGGKWEKIEEYGNPSLTTSTELLPIYLWMDDGE